MKLNVQSLYVERDAAAVAVVCGLYELIARGET
jgi:hypothetical protein